MYWLEGKPFIKSMKIEDYALSRIKKMLQEP
jgi:hypothetical protein